MAPRYSAPRVWKRPYTSIYNDNYRYGNSLYAEAITDIERKYNEAIARTTFRHDRPDLSFQSFSDSQLVGQSALRHERSLASAKAAADSLTDSFRYRSISTSRAGNYSPISQGIEDRLSNRLQHSESFDTYQAQKALANVHADLEESKLRRSRSTSRRTRPESSYAISAFEEALRGTPSSDGPRDAFWMERWYRNSMRSVAYNLYPPTLMRALRELQTELDTVSHQLTDQEEKIKHESTVIKNKINQDITDLMISVDDQDRQISDLHKILKKQAKNISDLSLELEASQRHYVDAHEQVTQTQRRCLNLCHEIDEIRSSLDKTVHF